MKKLMPTGATFKVLLLVMACIVTLTLLASCNGLPSVTPLPSEEPAGEPTDTDVSGKLPGATDFTDIRPSPANGAFLGSPSYDMFLKIDGVPGESTDEKHKEWIEVLSFSHAVSHAVSGSIRESTNHQDFSIMKTLDKTSPKLMLYCSDGKNIAEVTFVLCKAGGDKQEFMQYKMTDVTISSVSYAGSLGTEGLPTEEVTFNYRKIDWIYTVIDPITGKPKGQVRSYWDLVTNSGY
jgi:type VI secretion system secreted protein Hcp